MAIFLHTADWQIGKPFGAVSKLDMRVILQQERLAAIGRMADVVRQHQASFVLIAGDVFDSPSPEKSTVSKACEAIGQLGVPAYAIPGNHDHGGPLGPWEQSFFKQEQERLAPNFRVLLEPAPVVLGDAVIFPCPLLQRHEPNDLTGWLRYSSGLAEYGERARIVLAHGSVQGFGSDDDDTAPNRLDIGALNEADWDYIALGDWHGTKQVAAKAWYAGTPEPDRFPRGADYATGQVLVVDAARGRSPKVSACKTGGFGWHRLDQHFNADSDLAVLSARYDQLVGGRVHRDLLRLGMSGALGLHALTELETMLTTWDSRLLRLEQSGSALLAPTEEDLDRLTMRAADPITSRVAVVLRDQLQDPDLHEVAQAALRELHLAITGEG
jgi:DNA repair exonuclease SbcCD nuclease subunit